MIYLIKIAFYSIILIEIVLFLREFSPSRPKIICNFNQETFLKEIQHELSADTVKMISRVLKEESYFPTLTTINLIIDNPTTSIYNFKNYDIETRSVIDAAGVDEDRFKEFGKNYALRITNDCELNEFNDIIISFGKTDTKGIFHQLFICHYSDFIKPKLQEK